MGMRKALFIGAAVACAAVTGGCAVADPDTSQAVLRYSGGWFSSQAFNKCIPPGVRDVTTAGMQHYYYPNGQRTFTFSDLPNADAPPLQVSTKAQGGGGIKLTVRGTVTFRLNTDCTEYKEYKTTPNGQKVVVADYKGGLFQRFHDVIGKHSGAYATSGGEPQPDGWEDVMRIYVGGPIQKAANDAGLNFTWQELYGDPVKNKQWQDAVVAALPALVTAQAGADHFLIDNVQLLQPTLPDALQQEMDNNQAAVLRQNTANTDKATANGFPGGVGGYLDYLRQLSVNDAIKSGKVRVIPVPQGSGVIVNGG